MGEEEKVDPMDELIEADELEVEDLEVAEETAEEPEKEEEAEAKPDEPEKPSVEDLVKKLEFLEKENKGLYHAQKSEREKRQSFQSELDQIKGALAEARTRREQMVEEAAEQSVEGVTTKEGFPVEFDDDGNAFVPQKYFKGLVESEIKKVTDQLNEMSSSVKDQNFKQETVEKNKAIISKTISMKDEYQSAFPQVKKAFDWLDNKCGEVLRHYGLEPKNVSVDEMADFLEKKYGDQFSTEFPGIELDVAMDSMRAGMDGLYRPRKLKKALDSVLRSQKTDKKDDQTTKNLQFFKGKGSNLSGQQNQKGTTGRSLDDIAEEYTAEEFLEMPENEFSKVEKMAFRLSK